MANEELHKEESELTPAADETTNAAANVSEEGVEEEPLDDLLLADTVAVGSAHDDYDWARDKRGRVLYSADTQCG